MIELGRIARRNRAAVLIGGASALTLAIAMPASAQTEAAPMPAAGPVSPPPASSEESNDASLQAIVVTAQRFSEDLQKVPIAVSAINADTLESKGIRSTDDLNLLVPSLNTQRISGVGAIFLRGVGSNSRAPGLEPPIAFYVDGVYLPGALSSSSTFNAIDRVEVLKGPQGTLFGRNSMGGLVNIITSDPSDTLTGHIKGGYGNYDTLEGDLYVSGPITNNLAADFSAYGYDQGEGWGRNLVLGGDANYRKEYQFRSKWQWKPGADTVITLAADYAWNSTDLGATAMTLPDLPPPPPSLALAFFRGSIYDTISDLRNTGVIENYGGYFRISHDLGGVRLVNTSAYRMVTREDQLDNDATPYLASHAFFTDNTESFSNELQVLGSPDNPLQWQAGLFYFHSASGYQPQTIFAPAFGAALFRRNDSEQVNNSYSAYAQATFPLFSDATKVTLGGRYTTDRKKFTGVVSSAAGLIANVDDRQNESKFTYRVAISHEFTPTVLGYASVSSGFKSGYWNASNPTQPPVNPEELTSYEVGLKSELFDRRVRLNLSAFYYDYTNLQLIQTRVEGALTANAAEATVYGMELEGQANITRNFSVTYGLSLIKSKYDSYPNATSFVVSPTDGIGIAVPVDNTGNDLQRTPKATANIGFDWTIPTDNSGEFGVSGNYAYNDGFFFEPDNQYRAPAYSLVNMELRWTEPSERFIVRAWAKNLLDKEYYTLIRTASRLPPYGSPGAPRTYGATVQFNF